MLHRSTVSARSLALLVAAASLFVACKGSGGGSAGEPLGHDASAPQPALPGADGGEGTTPQAGGGVGDGGVDPGPPAVQLVGRFDTRDAAGPQCAWPGCRIVARFRGTRVSVRLREELQPFMDGGPSEWDVSLDGALKPKIVTDAAGTAQDYVIAEGLADGAHVVELYKRSEAQNGTTQFLGYDFGGGTLLPPPLRKTRRIEIIGDSVSSGYGVEGVGLDPCPPPAYAAKYENFHISMGALLGELVDADVAGTVFAGKGIARNVWTPDTDTMPLLFLRSRPADDPTSVWDFSRFVSDVVIVMMGGNDYAVAAPVDLGPPTLAAFTSAYAAFAATIRQKYPAAHLFLTVPPPLTDLDPPGNGTRSNVVAAVHAVTSQRNAAGDAKVYAFEPDPGDSTEYTGCEGHGNPQFHQRVAKELATVVKARTGWN